MSLTDILRGSQPFMEPAVGLLEDFLRRRCAGAEPALNPHSKPWNDPEMIPE